MAESVAAKKSKKKFISINEIDNILLPGRNRCDCEASVHELICNCLNCGRIVCKQENKGPCFTCGVTLVTKAELLEIMRRNSELAAESKTKKEKNFTNRQDGKKQPVPMNLKEIASSLIGLDQATEYKDRLLEYERTTEKLTKVIDDELDYFDLTRENWLSNEKREELKEKVDKLHEEKFEIDRRYELDFNTRQVVEVNIPKIKDLNQEVNKLKEETEFESDYQIVDFREIMDNQPELEPYYMESDEKERKKDAKKSSNSRKSKSLNKQKIFTNITIVRSRLQDSEIFETVDEGYAISINQPWASLLVEGIKLHEGRSWLTTHRGPLYIHASEKSPRKNEIEEACFLFRLIIGKPIRFPDNYPLGCIIGRANLNKCLTQQEYETKFGNSSYVEDPYVFIFDNIIKLEVNVPCSGKPKIFKLEKSIFKVLSSQITHTYSSKN